jgi:hypothetical protein
MKLNEHPHHEVYLRLGKNMAILFFRTFFYNDTLVAVATTNPDHTFHAFQGTPPPP